MKNMQNEMASNDTPAGGTQLPEHAQLSLPKTYLLTRDPVLFCRWAVQDRPRLAYLYLYAKTKRRRKKNYNRLVREFVEEALT